MNLDDIRKLAPSRTLRDGQVRGLQVRANADGSKSFFLYYRTKAGVERRPKIGTLGEITLAEARKRAKALLDQIAVGGDPKGEWKRQKEELTVCQLFELTYQGHWSQPRYQNSRWAKEVKKLYKNHIQKAFGGVKLSDLTVGQVRAWHGAKSDTPVTANRALSVLSKIFNHAEEAELRSQNTNPCNLVKAYPEKKRDRYATEDEIKAFGALLLTHADSHPESAAFLYLLIYTGSRPSAIGRATWEDLKEFEIAGEPYGLLSFAGKTSSDSGAKETVILPPQAMRALQKLPRLKGRPITGITSPRGLWRKLRAEVGCKDLWMRDWRRTFASVGLDDDMELGSIGELLNHKSTQTTKIYAKLREKKKAKAATRIADRLEGFMTQEERVDP